MGFMEILRMAAKGERLSSQAALLLSDCDDLPALTATAAALRDAGHDDRLSYSKKVFVPLTQLCRDSCHYCTFAHSPRKGQAAFLSLDQVLTIARAGQHAGCKEVLFTLGDKPELRYAAARNELEAMGHGTTFDYLAQAAEMVLRETGLLPHLNPGVMSSDELASLRCVSASMGIMLESTSERLCGRGGPHFGSPDKSPAVRLATIAAAGEAAIPFTSGILIGIGETRRERVEALLALRDLHDRHGHLQEIIVQNFRAKPGTRMANAPEPSFEDHLWTIAMARIIFGPQMNIQAPPNLSAGSLDRIVGAGINDWGGVSPVTIDHVNPEAPWPEIEKLAAQTATTGKVLVERLAVYPPYVADADRWLDAALKTPALLLADATGFGREDDWRAGAQARIPATDQSRPAHRVKTAARDVIDRILLKAQQGDELSESEIAALFGARGEDFQYIVDAADEMRRSRVGNTVTYVVNRNINYTNICYFRCQFCAFSKGKLSENLRGRPYDLGLEEIARRTGEAWDRGATEVCLQGGIHPAYTGETYLSILRAVKEAAPAIQVHAFSPLEVWQGAATLNMPVGRFLAQLKSAGLGSLPGTAAEILDDEVRAIICPDKITTDQWLTVMAAAHEVGLRSTATIMFGHVDRPIHWARHLMRIRSLQMRTGGFTEFVPLPFVPMETPIFIRGRARSGPTFRVAVLMHAVARLVLNPIVANIQTSWVKMGQEGVKLCLGAGVNDLGGTLMNESITRAAGAVHGQEMPPREMDALVRSLGREPRQRTTTYGSVPEHRRRASFEAGPLKEPVNTPARQYERGS
jgi:FO synthase